jgi:hypothetical protein
MINTGLFVHEKRSIEMPISNEMLDLIEQRYNLKTATEVPFDPERTPRLFVGEKTKIETIFLLDETGARMTTLLVDETVSDVLKLLGENSEDVKYVLSREDETVAAVLHG